MTTTQLRTLKHNAKFIDYVLGHRPDEFGLIPDDKGFVKIKTLVKALHEEAGWRFLRPSHLQELILGLQPPPVEIEGARIRARDRSHLPRISPDADMPKLLFASVRRRAYPATLEKGIRAGGEGYVLLSSDRAMAERLGRRIDNEPVLLTVNTASACGQGVTFRQYGRSLYLTDSVPAGTFSGPPLPKEKTKPDTSGQPATAQPPIAAGSYFPDLTRTGDKPEQSKNRLRKKEKSWQKDRRQARRHKRRITGMDDFER